MDTNTTDTSQAAAAPSGHDAAREVHGDDIPPCSQCDDPVGTNAGCLACLYSYEEHLQQLGYDDSDWTMDDLDPERSRRDSARAILRRAADETGVENITQSVYAEWADDVDDAPSLWSLHEMFGSWNDAKRAARLPVTDKSRHYTDEEVQRGVVRVATRLGKVPTRTEYTDFRADEPVATTVVNHYDGDDAGRPFAEAVQAAARAVPNGSPMGVEMYRSGIDRTLAITADPETPVPRITRATFAYETGFDPDNAADALGHGDWGDAVAAVAEIPPKEIEVADPASALETGWPAFTDDQIAAAVAVAAEQTPGDGLPPSDYEAFRDSEAPGLPEQSTVFRRLGAWNDALSAAGVGSDTHPDAAGGEAGDADDDVDADTAADTTERDDEPSIEADMVEALEAADAAISGHLSKDSYTEWHVGTNADYPSATTIANTVGSWNDAKAAAGLDTVRHTWTRVECLDALIVAAGGDPADLSTSVYESVRRGDDGPDRHDMPSRATIAGVKSRHFGSWADATAAASERFKTQGYPEGWDPDPHVPAQAADAVAADLDADAATATPDDDAGEQSADDYGSVWGDPGAAAGGVGGVTGPSDPEADVPTGTAWDDIDFADLADDFIDDVPFVFVEDEGVLLDPGLHWESRPVAVVPTRDQIEVWRRLFLGP